MMQKHALRSVCAGILGVLSVFFLSWYVKCSNFLNSALLAHTDTTRFYAPYDRHRLFDAYDVFINNVIIDA